MLRVAWSTLVQPTTQRAPDAPAVDLAALFACWQVTRHKGDFIAALDLDTAQELTDYIMAHTSRHRSQPRRLPDPELLPDPIS